MEDGHWLSAEDKKKMESLRKELVKLKKEHKEFAKAKNELTPAQRDAWRLNAQKMDKVYVDMKDMRFKNIMEAGKHGG